MSQHAGIHRAYGGVFSDGGGSVCGVVCVEGSRDTEESKDHNQTAAEDKTTTP